MTQSEVHSTARYWYRVSERGNGIGLTIIEAAEAAEPLVVHVLPKLWRTSAFPRVVMAPTQGGSVTVFEGDVVGFEHQWARRLDSVALDMGVDEDPEGGDLEAGAGDQLWRRAAPPTQEPVSPEPVNAEMATGIRTMWSLVLRHDQVIAPVPATVLDAAAGSDLLSRHDDLRTIVRRRFIDRVLDLLPLRRPTYEMTTEALSAIRGRIDPAALIRRQAMRLTRVECEYDTLTADTLLWRAVRCALEHCADTAGREEAALAAIARLDDVGSERAEVILAQSSAGRPGSRDRALLALYDQALLILRDRFQHGRADEAHDGVAVNIKFVTSTLWEQLLESAFAAAGAQPEPGKLNVFYHAADAGDWTAASSKAPDLIVTAPCGTQAIIDAKYMTTPSLFQASLSAQYQIATYALRSGLPAFLAFSARHGDAGTLSPEVAAIPTPVTGRDLTVLSADAARSAIRVGSVRMRFPGPDEPDAEAVLHDQAVQFVTWLTQLKN